MSALLEYGGFWLSEGDGKDSYAAALVWLCAGGRFTTESIKYLLSKSADPERCESTNGWTCLHACFIGPDWFPGEEVPPDERAWIRRIRESILYLVRQGADPWAETFEFQSVSEFAYTVDPLSYGDTDFCAYGSLKGDLWDSVLAECGYDIRAFRKGYARTAQYMSEYSREGFESLWKGLESLCPYYNDKEGETWCPCVDKEACLCVRVEEAWETDSDDDSESGDEGGGVSLR